MKKLLSIYCLLGIELLSAEAQKETKIILNKNFSEIASANAKSVEEFQKIIKLWYGENAVLKRNENGYVIVLKEQSEKFPGETMKNPHKFGLPINSVSRIFQDCNELRGEENATCTLLESLLFAVYENKDNHDEAQPDKFAKKYLK